MTRIQLEIPDELVDTARARAADAGFSSIEEYASALFKDELRIVDESLERLLQERLNSGEIPVEATSDFWTQMQGKIDEQFESSKS